MAGCYFGSHHRPYFSLIAQAKSDYEGAYNYHGNFCAIEFFSWIYGMNFEHTPELKHKYGYFFLLGTMEHS